MNDNKIILVIQRSPNLSEGDKSFLISKLDQLSPLEKLKLERTLISGKIPQILENLNLMRQRFFEQEAPKVSDPLSQLVEKFIPRKVKKILSQSIFSKPYILGGPQPRPVPPFPSSYGLQSLNQITHPVQLEQLHPKHISFSISDNTDQLLQDFFTKVEKLMSGIEDVNIRRNYFMNFIQSPLFRSYLNTGITALRHPELKPRQVSLNLLFQIDPQYLNNKQFQTASIISHNLRSLCGI